MCDDGTKPGLPSESSRVNAASTVGVDAGADQGHRDVGAPERLALRLAQHGVEGHLDPVRVQLRDDRFDPAAPRGAVLREGGGERRVSRREAIAEDVHLVAAIGRVDLDAGHDAQTSRNLEAVVGREAVVVADRADSNAAPVHEAQQNSRLARTVATVRVRVKVDEHGLPSTV